MQYQNAAKVLPRQLLRAVQAYAGGELLYIPMSGGSKNKWGTCNGTKLHYIQRNTEICSRYHNGESFGTLAEKYSLTEDSIRKIVRHQNL